MARSITCECGDTLSAADDEQLFHEIRRHATLMHGGIMGASDEQIRSRIAAEARDSVSA